MDIAICLIAYNRVNSLKRLLQSLDDAVYPQPVKLYISIDKSDIREVEECASSYVWKFGEKEVILHNERQGLKKHVLSCGDLSQKHDALIVLEDDVFVAPGFMLFARETVKQFSCRKDIAGISLYSFMINYHSCQPFIPIKECGDVFLMQNAQSWGQVWMKEQWAEFREWYNKNSDEFGHMSHLPKTICSWSGSWLKYHTRYCIENNKYFVYPYISYSTCFSDDGEHIKDTSPIVQTPLSEARKIQLCLEPSVSYDCYFENQMIYEWLGMNSDELCVDYYGDNGNQKKCRFWLSRLLMPYKVLRSFGLQYRPYELNIKYSVEGNDFFLYDTRESSEVNHSVEYLKRQYFYMYGTTYIDINPLKWENQSLKESIANKEDLIAGKDLVISNQNRIIIDQRQTIVLQQDKLERYKKRIKALVVSLSIMVISFLSFVIIKFLYIL